MYHRSSDGYLMLDGDKVDKVVIDEVLIMKMFRWVRMGGAVNLGVKSPWWAKYVESDWPEEFKFDRPTNVEIDIYWKLLKVIGELHEFDKSLIIKRLGAGKRLNYRKCAVGYGVSHESFRQQLQQVILMVQKAFDKPVKNTV